MTLPVPVIDLFAGPGGLGEGFSRAKSASFQVAVSIEKDGQAFETLQLRAAHRSLLRSGATPAVWRKWDGILAEAPWNTAFEVLLSSNDQLIADACEEARREAWNLELSPDNRGEVSGGIRSRLASFCRGGRLPGNAVLIGGPPCQAYSIVGRSRNRGTKGYLPENDHRHFLYREYLHVIAEFRPAIFVMENVKGILSSQVHERQIFQSILSDLKRPDLASGEDTALEYDLFALGAQSESLFDLEPDQFLVHAEQFGVPQARHRVIIFGVRRDVSRKAGTIPRLRPSRAPSVRDVIADLPRLRSELSHRGGGLEWIQSFDLPLMSRAIASLRAADDPLLNRVAKRMESACGSMRKSFDPGSGSDKLLLGPGSTPVPSTMKNWFRDRSLSLLANHESRAHMPSDLVRYLFVASFGEVTGVSPRLGDFPKCLLPEHKNVDPSRPEVAIFKDRFRVQVADEHSMTVTSHIAKDGHAFIHFDSSQCRSLTVRESARLQTFPDSYVFLGNRTSQFTQVGNAVPPYLAIQIAEIAGEVLSRARLTTPGGSTDSSSRSTTHQLLAA
jgi:DNA (cytosine-5)-methyltransferase 1